MTLQHDISGTSDIGRPCEPLLPSEMAPRQFGGADAPRMSWSSVISTYTYFFWQPRHAHDYICSDLYTDYTLHTNCLSTLPCDACPSFCSCTPAAFSRQRPRDPDDRYQHIYYKPELNPSLRPARDFGI